MTMFTKQLIKQDRKCFYCGKVLSRREATEDHYIPKSKGGSLQWDNKVIACKPCNTKKGAELPNLFHFHSKQPTL